MAVQPQKKTFWRSRWAKLAVVLLVSLALLEVSLRLVLGLGSPIMYQKDAACGYLVAPNQHVWRFFCQNDINRFSMRSGDVQEHKPSGTFRVLMVGDSVTYGTTYLDQSKIFTSLIAGELPALIKRPVEVLNASAGGWAPSNELGYITSRGTFESDVVVMVLNSGDLTQAFNPAQESYPRPLCAISELFGRYVIPRVMRSLSARDAGSEVFDGPDAARETPHVLATLDEAATVTRSAKAKFVVVFSPGGHNWERPIYIAGLEMLRRWAQGRGVPLVDLTPRYRQLPDSEIYLDDLHLRARAHAIVAEMVEQELVKLAP